MVFGGEIVIFARYYTDMHKYVIIILALMALVACGSRKAAEQGADAGETGRGTATAGAVAAVSPSADSLMAFVKTQMALGPRTPGSEANRQCRELITNTLLRYGADTVLVQTVPVTVWDGSRHEANPSCPTCPLWSSPTPAPLRLRKSPPAPSRTSTAP